MKGLFFSDDLLDQKRKEGDPKIDSILRDYFQDPENKKELKIWLESLKTNNDIYSNSNLSKEVQNQLISVLDLPPWYSEEKFTRAQIFFVRNSPWIMNLLGLLSLPYCYAAANGARVLGFTERLSLETEQRLRETAEFVWGMMNPSSLKSEGNGLIMILKIRLIHAFIRKSLLQNPSWNLDWGIPLNQEDMAGTNLSFSLIIIRGLRKIGIHCSMEDQEAFLHSWNLIGYLLGLNTELIPERPQDTIQLEKKIKERQFRESEQGKKLTAELLKYFHQLPKVPGRPQIFVENWMLDLMGQDIGKLLGIKRAQKSGLSLTQLYLLNQFGFLNKGNNKETFETRYTRYQLEGQKTRNLDIPWDNYSKYPLPM